MGTLIGALILIRGLLGMADADADEPAPPADARTSELRGAVAIAIMFAYAALIHVLGIAVASALVIPALAVLYGERRWGGWRSPR